MIDIRCNDWVDELQSMPDESVQCVVTSPPYWGLRDYGVEGQLGLEETPKEHCDKLVEGFSEVRRVLKKNGTLWLNYGDTYNQNQGDGFNGQIRYDNKNRNTKIKTSNLPAKNLYLMPHRVALALQKDGWWIRNDIIWHKPNPMPESVTDRCTTSHEHIFLLTKSKQYKFNQDAIKEEPKDSTLKRDEYSRTENEKNVNDGYQNYMNPNCGTHRDNSDGANKRDVWKISTKPYSDAHFATFPPELPETCIKAGTDEGQTVLDPFCGAGTTGLVADRLRRDFIGVELNEEYCEMARDRIRQDAPLLNEEVSS